MDQKYLEQVRQIVLNTLGDAKVQVFLFGSRARGEARTGSDVDVGLLGEQPVPPATLAKIREALELSHVPYEVDVVDLRCAEEDFVRTALQEAVPWSG